MKHVLNFVCPTDHLETIIDQSFDHLNFYCTSLGNCLKIDAGFIASLISIINKNKIGFVYFILSDQNEIIKDAIQNRNYSDIRGLSKLSIRLEGLSEKSREIWDTEELYSLIVSNHLNLMIKELAFNLKDKTAQNIVIQGKIYQHDTATFSNVFPDTVSEKYLNLN